MPSPLSYDCVIVGGGPGGAALAGLLGDSGLRVLLADVGARTGGAPHETLLASARAGLERAGLAGMIEAAAETDRRQHGAIWGADTLLFRDEPEPGLVLDRGRFEAQLRAAACERGAEVRERTRVRGPLPMNGAGALELVGPDGARELVHAQRIVLATGKRPAHDLLPLRELARGPETAALSLAVECREGANLAMVEAVPSGWWWWIGDCDRGGTATLLCDVGELSAIGTRALLARARRESTGPARDAQQARLTHATRTTARFLRSDSAVLLLGDAAATIDPLASQGVEKALLGAEHVAAAVHAAREHADWWPRLCQTHSLWERGLYEAHSRTTGSFLQRERRFADAPFWHRRAGYEAHEESDSPEQRLVRCEEVEETAVLERFGDGFREVAGAAHRGDREARATIGRVPIGPLLEVFAQPRTMGDAVAAAGNDARLFVIGPQAVESAARELRARGWIRPASAATESP